MRQKASHVAAAAGSLSMLSEPLASTPDGSHSPRQEHTKSAEEGWKARELLSPEATFTSCRQDDDEGPRFPTSGRGPSKPSCSKCGLGIRARWVLKLLINLMEWNVGI